MNLRCSAPDAVGPPGRNPGSGVSNEITVTELVFVLTIVTLQIASGQYSPRLLRNFVGDPTPSKCSACSLAPLPTARPGCIPAEGCRRPQVVLSTVLLLGATLGSPLVWGPASSAAQAG